MSGSASWVDGLWLTSDESRTECFKTWSSYDNGSKAVGSRLLLGVVRKRIYRRRVMLILEYISTHGNQESGNVYLSQKDIVNNYTET